MRVLERSFFAGAVESLADGVTDAILLRQGFEFMEIVDERKKSSRKTGSTMINEILYPNEFAVIIGWNSLFLRY